MENILKVSRLEGYTSGVRSATWHPSGSLLVCQIRLRVDNVTEDDRRQHAHATEKLSFGIWQQIRQSLKRLLKG